MEENIKVKYFLEYVFLENEFKEWLEKKGYSKNYIETSIRLVRRVYRIFKKIPELEEIDIIKENYHNKKSLKNIKTSLRRYYDFLEEEFNFKF